ncbi:hypothetical protein, partial [Mesorhizobium sp. M5C.F.Ca.ET.164.01.1.1]|uniref:hypothetical protein n=1 Tax=Mesorhizobium sp. M5C.F.Ca.ET.164.01.1.1 TaxID=2563957 RepID=UPI001AEE16D1
RAQAPVWQNASSGYTDRTARWVPLSNTLASFNCSRPILFVMARRASDIGQAMPASIAKKRG